MNSRVDAIVEQARALSREERVAVLDALEELITPPDSAWEAAWAKECAARLDAYRHGELVAEDFDVAMERLRQELLLK